MTSSNPGFEFMYAITNGFDIYIDHDLIVISKVYRITNLTIPDPDNFYLTYRTTGYVAFSTDGITNYGPLVYAGLEDEFQVTNQTGEFYLKLARYDYAYSNKTIKLQTTLGSRIIYDMVTPDYQAVADYTGKITASIPFGEYFAMIKSKGRDLYSITNLSISNTNLRLIKNFYYENEGEDGGEPW